MSRTFIVIVLALFSLVGFAIILPSCEGWRQYNRLSKSQGNLRRLIEAEDRYYSKTGEYLPLDPSSDNTDVKKKLGWDPGRFRSGCEYGVTVSGMAYTAVVRCPLDDGTPYYLGFVKTEPGKQIGIEGPFGKCKPDGIYAGSRHLVNTIGPCFEQKGGILGVVSGRLKRLVVHTYPPNAQIYANGVLIGETSDSRLTVSQNYGSFWWGEPCREQVTVRVVKAGYHPVEFEIDWDGYTYTAAITLRPETD